MNSTLRAGLIGAGIAGASVFLLDPDRGARRRALVRDKAARVSRKTRHAADATRRDLGNRLAGLRSRARARLDDETVDDYKLRERVRATLGRVTSHPRAIVVSAKSGWVTLTGDAIEAQIPSIVSAVENVRGVEGVQNEIRPHAEAASIPSLQGAPRRPGSWATWIPGSWSPTALLIAGAATGAVALTAVAMARRANGDTDTAITEIDILTVETLPPDSAPVGDIDGLL
jgi:gas vesicle protein